LKRTSLEHRSRATLSDSFVLGERIPEPSCYTLVSSPLPLASFLRLQDLADALSADSELSANGFIRQPGIFSLEGQYVFVPFGIID
jgi:hypothetical protein